MAAIAARALAAVGALPRVRLRVRPLQRLRGRCRALAAATAIDDDGPFAPEMEGVGAHAQRVRVCDTFLEPSLASSLRATFDARHADPRSLGAERFVWDYWHMPGQYRQLRTPAQDYFSSGEGSTAGDWEALERALLDFGRRELGCSALTPPWLSSYVSGMQQEWHTDNVHGPWAFVLSLTHWDERKFSGGETELLTQQTLDYWSTSGASSGVAEAPQLVERVEPLFNRLTLFDPRLPHGVREVQGEMDPRKGRLVLHGWFTEPVPYYEGPVAESDSKLAAAEETINERLAALFGELEQLPPCLGTLVVRMDISGKDGAVRSVRPLTDTVVVRPCGADAEEVRAQVMAEIGDALGTLWFDGAIGAEDSEIVLPLVFE